MDKIIEKLAGVLSAEDLNEVKASFESAVDERVQAKLDEETKNLAKKADEFCQLKIKEAVEKKTAELEELANKYCEERCAKITEKAQKRVDTQCKKLEEAAEQYIFEYFEEKFKERYGEELDRIEESMISGMDKYLEYTISEKISPKLIQKTAVNETYEPIINAIKTAFEDKYVPLDTTGSSKIREANADKAQLEESLKKQVSENMRLAKMVEDAQKRAVVAEATSGLADAQKARVQKFFESKSYSETKRDINEYISVINERAPLMKTQTRRIVESRTAPKTAKKSSFVEDTTDNLITEKYRPKQQLSATDAFLLKSANYCK